MQKNDKSINFMGGGILISGGRSERMGSDKASMVLKGKELGLWSAEIMRAYCQSIIVSSNNTAHIKYGDSIVKDEIGAGPLAGLCSGLIASDYDWNVVLACDTPFVSADVIQELLSHANGDNKAIIAVDGNGKVHPLIGIYHKSIAPIIKLKLEKGHYSMMKFLNEIGAKQIHFNALEPFKNINDMEALKKVEKNEDNKTIVICGNGQNVGKTTLTQHIIGFIKRSGQKVYSIKISNHLHPLSDNEHFLLQGEDFDIIEERRINSKDSSLLLQAGAEKSYYIQCKAEYLLHCYHTVLQHIPEGAIIVCESASLSTVVKPDLMLFVKGDSSDKNEHLEEQADYIVRFGADFNAESMGAEFEKKLMQELF